MDVLNGGGGCGQVTGMRKHTRFGGRVGQGPRLEIPGEAELSQRRCQGCSRRGRVSDRGASGQQVTTWVNCKLSKGPPGGSWALPGCGCTPGFCPSLSPARRLISEPPAPSAGLHPPPPGRGPSAHTAVPGLLRRGRPRGAPRRPPRPGWGRGS